MNLQPFSLAEGHLTPPAPSLGFVLKTEEEILQRIHQLGHNQRYVEVLYENHTRASGYDRVRAEKLRGRVAAIQNQIHGLYWVLGQIDIPLPT